MLDCLGAQGSVVGSEVRLVEEVGSVVGFVEGGLVDAEGSVVVDLGVVVLGVIFRTKICMLITMGLTHQGELMDLVEVH